MPYRNVTAARSLAQNMGNLTEHLTYQGIHDGVVYTLGNHLTLGVNLQLVSAAQATSDLRLQMRDRIMRAIQGSVPIGAVVRVYFDTRPATEHGLQRFMPGQAAHRGSDGPHEPAITATPVVRRMRQANFDLLERMRRGRYISDSDAYVTVTLRAPGRAKKQKFTTEQLQPLTSHARQLRNRLCRQLTLGGMTATPMTTDDAWNRIMTYFNPAMAPQRKPPYLPLLDQADVRSTSVLRVLKGKQGKQATLPTVATMRAQVACTDIDLDYDNCFMLGQHRVGIVSFLKPTRHTRPDSTEQIIQALAGTQSVFMIEYLVVDAPKIRADINAALNRQDEAARDPTLKAGREIYSRIAKGTGLVQAMEDGQVYTQMSMHVMIFGRTQAELDDRREAALGAFSNVAGCLPRVATNATAIHLFLQNAPFSGVRSDYQVGAYYEHATDCIPKVGAWDGNPRGVLPLRARNGKVFSISPLGQRNAGVIVSGSSGSGKSVAISQLAAGLIDEFGAGLTILDPKQDYRALFMALQAADAIVSIAPEATLPDGRRVCINPFDLPRGVKQVTAEKLAYLFDLFQALRLFDGSGRRRSILDQAIRNFYIKHSTFTSDGGVDAYEYDHGTLTDFQNVVKTLNTVGDQTIQDDPTLAREVADLANEILAYCGNTPIGTLLDGMTTVDTYSRYLYLDISGMMSGEQMTALGALLGNELVWNRTQQQDGYNVVVVEEGGVARDVPSIVRLTNRLFMTGRSLNIIPILAVQNMDSAMAYRAVINNVSTRIILASQASERHDVANLFELNPAMRALHASLGSEPGRYAEMLVLQNAGANGALIGDVGQLWLSKEAYWISTSVQEEADYRAQVAAEYFGGDEALAALSIAQEVHDAEEAA